ncbi:hypothetical protein [Thermoactinomyces sp. DSM 45892]|uniref:hypothetical protein n=1 Tax=Thermoactinomyces sp. DSM 45892 TaxID=1882753 RepID=UPI00089B9D8E|nr:hypothetical protein [Thermoactinomyces sp. DSM 45892]SDY84117.1 hypothetical protein SAMN05444416_10945 [Thermoactinomyces sp. DSM 45892]
MRDVFPTKYYSDEGFVERKIEINEEDLDEIIEEYLLSRGYDFDEIEIVNNREMNIWLHAKCRKYVDEENPEEDETAIEAEVEIKGKYDGNPIGGIIF